MPPLLESGKQLAIDDMCVKVNVIPVYVEMKWKTEAWIASQSWDWTLME